MLDLLEAVARTGSAKVTGDKLVRAPPPGTRMIPDGVDAGPRGASHAYGRGASADHAGFTRDMI
jgi:hypothetical protein